MKMADEDTSHYGQWTSII